MPTQVLITVDTELAWRHYVAGASWQENLARSFDPAGVGVPYQLDMLRAYGLKACFFVDPLPAVIYGLEPIRRMVEPILAAGQEVQLHAHPVWLSVLEGKQGGASFELTCFDAGRQRAILRQAHDLLVAAGAPKPIAFRAGSYAANADTLDALRSLGLRYDSSHNGSEHPHASALPLDRELVSPADCRGIVEIPVSQIETGPGKLRHLQLCAVSTDELREALEHGFDNRHPVTTLVSHSFELATRDGLRANRIVCRRFDALCSYLRDHADRLPTAFFSDLDGVALGAVAAPLPARRLRTARRVTEQIWANTFYERRV